MSQEPRATSRERGIATEILSIGDELLYGHVADTNASWLARQLLALGLPAAHFQTVGDELPEIVSAFRLALSRAEVVLATGGLGPTEDDLTVAGLAQALGLPLECRDEVLDQMASRLRRPREQFTALDRKQAFLPQGVAALRNDWGTAPGVRCLTGQGKVVFLMPGVPREMEGIFETWIAPWLKEHGPRRLGLALKHFHSFGVPEAVIGARIRDLMRPGADPDVGTRVSGGVVTVRVLARGGTQEQAEQTMAPVAARVREALSDCLFGEDGKTLAEAAGEALMQRSLTVAIAESCTAGLATALLANVSGISASLLEGAVVYSNESKVRVCGVRQETLARHGAVSAQAAQELAEGIRRRAGADLGLAITGIAGPTGGTPDKPVGLVFFAVAGPAGTQVAERRFPGHDRNVVRERAAHWALDLLRRAALEEAKYKGQQ
jgi:nicotinamide-nucleotide amidase